MSTVEPIKNLAIIKKIEENLNKTNKRNLLLFLIGINCGLRISDILSLNVEDVKDKNFISLIEQKTGKYKKIPINSKLKPIIKEFTKGRNAKEPLFKSKYNNRLERTNAYKIIKKECCKCLDETKIGTHTLRKTFGYHHYKKFNNLALLQKIFNHSSPQITLRYIGIEQTDIEESYLNFIL